MKRHQLRCYLCGRFASEGDIETFGHCFDCEERLSDEAERDDYDVYEDDEDGFDDDFYDDLDDDDELDEEDIDEDYSDDVGRTLLEQGCALTEDERQAFGISESEYINRMMRS